MWSRGVGLALSALLSDAVPVAAGDVGASFLQVRGNMNGSTFSSSLQTYLDRFQWERQQALLQYQLVEPSSDLERLVEKLTKPGEGEYGYQSVRTDAGALTNIILVIVPIGDRNTHARQMIEKHRDKILFLGMSSFEDYPLPPSNPFSAKFEADEYVGLFDGFLNMYRHPEEIYPKHVKTVLLSQSDFNLPQVETVPKGLPRVEPKYDFIMSGSNQDVAQDCVGWSSYAKNWSFAKEAFDVMCKEYGLKGVVIAARRDDQACSLPESCKGLVEETNYLDQNEFFGYMKQSRFMFLPQVHDASPRVAPQGLSHNLPLLMNRNIIGGWKYLNERTGESFNDLSDFRQALETLLRKEKNGEYTPQEFIYASAGSENAGVTFKKFIEDNFADRVKLPAGTKWITPY